jgi:hypothetical protein
LTLGDKDILQVDATIIVGILILLTLSNIAGDTSKVKSLVGYVAYSIAPFGISAILIIVLNLNKMVSSEEEMRSRKRSYLIIIGASLFSMLIGFFTFMSLLGAYFLPSLH